MVRNERHPVSSSLFAVAAIQAVVGFFGWSIHSPNFAPIDWVITFSFAIFASLAILARWARLPAAVIATVIYGGFLVMQVSISMELLMTGLVFKTPVVLLLLVALGLAFKGRQTTEQEQPV